MANFNGSKVDGNTVGASEWNQLASINNLITTSGQTLSTSNLEQSAISSARYSSAGNFFTDSGTANNYILTPVAPFKSPVSSTAGEGYFVGMMIRFKAGNACSGTSTANVNNAGAKSLKKPDGTNNLTSGDIPANTEVEFVYDGTNFVQSAGKISASFTRLGLAFLSNAITISNNATDANNDIDFSAGNSPLDDGSIQVLLSSTFVKRLDAAWVAGTNQGGLFSGTKANNTFYYCFAITNGTIIDAGFDISPTGANIPAGYKGSYRGAVLTDGSGNIRAFKLTAQDYEYIQEILDHTPSPTNGVYATYTLSCPKKNNIKVNLLLYIQYSGSSTVPLSANYRQTGFSGSNVFGGGAVIGFSGQNIANFVPVNSLGQIDLLFNFVAPAGPFNITTKGYFDYNIKI